MTTRAHVQVKIGILCGKVVGFEMISSKRKLSFDPQLLYFSSCLLCNQIPSGFCNLVHRLVWNRSVLMRCWHGAGDPRLKPPMVLALRRLTKGRWALARDHAGEGLGSPPPACVQNLPSSSRSRVCKFVLYCWWDIWHRVRRHLYN